MVSFVKNPAVDQPRTSDGRYSHRRAPCALIVADDAYAAASSDATPHPIIPDLIDDPVALEIADDFTDAGHDVVIVGGPVRDSLLGRTPKDLDLATSAMPDQTKAILDRHGDVYPLGEKYGTIAVHTDAGEYEVTTFRGDETYTEGSRNPEVTLGVALDEDLARRDFTVNAMAWRPSTGELVDPYGGQEDLKAGVLRTPLDPDVTFSDDPLRIPRAVRFASVNDWTIEPATLAGAQRNAEKVGAVARERRTAELQRILDAPDPAALTRAVDHARRIGCTRELFGQLDTNELAGHRIERVPPQHRLAALVFANGDHTEAHRELKAMTFPNRQADDALRTAQAATQMAHVRTVVDARRLVRSYDDRTLDGADHLLDAWDIDSPEPLAAAWADRERLRRPLPINGNDLLAEGLSGREVGAGLRHAEEAFLADPDLDRNGCLAAARASGGSAE